MQSRVWCRVCRVSLAPHGPIGPFAQTPLPAQTLPGVSVPAARLFSTDKAVEEVNATTQHWIKTVTGQKPTSPAETAALYAKVRGDERKGRIGFVWRGGVLPTDRACHSHACLTSTSPNGRPCHTGRRALGDGVGGAARDAPGDQGLLRR